MGVEGHGKAVDKDCLPPKLETAPTSLSTSGLIENLMIPLKINTTESGTRATSTPSIS